MADSFCYKYWQAKNIIMKMCQDRNYQAEWRQLSWSITDFFPHFQNGMEETNTEWFMPDIGFECFDVKKNQSVFIMFFKPEATGKEAVMSLLNYCFQNKIIHIILVVPYPLSHQAVEVLENQDMQDFDAAANKLKNKNKKSEQEQQKEKTKADINNISSGPLDSSVPTILSIKKNDRPIVEVEMFELKSVLFNLTISASQPLVYALTEEETKVYYKKNKCQPPQMSGLLMDDPLCQWYHFEKGQLIRLTPRDQLHRPDFVVVGNQK